MRSGYDQQIHPRRTRTTTNQYTIYRTDLLPTSDFVNTLDQNASPSNSLGRTEITADETLDLTGAVITGGDYVSLKTTNHFIGSPGAGIVCALQRHLSGLNQWQFDNDQPDPAHGSPPERPTFRLEQPLDQYRRHAAGTTTNFYHVLIADGQFAALRGSDRE